MREKAGEAVGKLADVTQQAGSQAKQTASSLAADANQKAKGFCRQASSRHLNVRRASARTSMPNTMPESPHIPDMRRGSGTACVYLAAGLLRDVGQLGDSFASLFAHLKRFAG
jgi:hypothetical protein